MGYASDSGGHGLVYIRADGAGPQRVARCSFEVMRPHDDREIGFTALAAMLNLLRRRSSRIAIVLEDGELVADLTRRRDVPVELMLPYIRARCALNAFASWKLSTGNLGADLSARAAAEVSLAAAA
jgi:hypothetical protein